MPAQTVKKTAKPLREVERIHTGVRLEKRLLKVLKGLAECLDLSLGDLLEGVALHALEWLYGADLSGHAGELAYHAEQAGLPQQTFDYSLQAGDEALQIYANAEAVAHYTRALGLGQLASKEQLIHVYRNCGRALELMTAPVSWRA